MRISRILLLAAVTTVALLGSTQVAVAAPCGSPADCVNTSPLKRYADQDTRFVGWGRVDADRCFGSSYCFSRQTQVQCFAAPCPSHLTTYVVAYSWTHGAWSQTKLSSGSHIYIYPYAPGWSWAWTQSTGWLAIPSKFALTHDYTCYDCFPPA